MPEHGGWEWPNAGLASPFYNKIIIEARMDTGPFSKSSWGRRRQRFSWLWFRFRNVYYSEKEHKNIWSPEFRIKVMMWGDRFYPLVKDAKHNDLIHVEGFLTTTKDDVGHYQMAILAKEAFVRKDVRYRPPQWDALAARSKAVPRFRAKGMLPVTDRKLREEEREKLVARGLIKPSPGDLAKIPDDVPEQDFSDYDFGV